MNLAGNFFDEDLRRSLRQTLALHLPADKVHEVADLAVHAAESALDSLSRVTFSSLDSRVCVTASSVAVGLLAHRLAEVQDAYKSAAIDSKMPYHHATVSVQR